MCKSISRWIKGGEGVRVLGVLSIWRAILLPLLLAAFATPALGQTSLGPNILTDASFEGGSNSWTLQGPFSFGSTGVRTGTTSVQTTLTSKPTWYKAFQVVPVWANTNYVSSIWISGSGKLGFGISDSSTYVNIALTTATASSTWRQVSLPWSTGTSTSVHMFVWDGEYGNTGTTIYTDDWATCLASGSDIHFDPNNPAASGFQLYFDEEFDNRNLIDTYNTGATGFNWYQQQFYGEPATTPSMYSVSSSGTLIISGCPVTWGSTLHTTEPDSVNGKGFHGTVFSVGSGAYLEARILLSNTSSIGLKAWPAFWSNDIKSGSRMGRPMPGNTNDYEYIEDDFMELNPSTGHPVNDYSSTMHDWCGTIATGTTYNFANSGNAYLPQPLGTDFTQWHRYGVLWVPGTASNNWIGYRQAFFDGVPQTAVCWQGNQIGAFPPSGNYLFSLLQQDQLEMILGSSEGGIPTMQVDYVHVYAADSSSVTVVPAGLPVPFITSTLASTATAGSLFTYSIAATDSPATYLATGLPGGLSLNGSTGVISGTSTTGGTTSTVMLYAINSSGTAVATLQLALAPTFFSWQNHWFTPAQLADPSISGASASAAGDGVPNLIKYALNLAPSANGPGSLPTSAIKTAGGKRYLTLTFTKVISATDITYIPQVSSDLVNWYSDIGHVMPLSTTDNADGLTQTVAVEDTSPVTTSAPAFIRLEVTKP